MIQLRKLLLDKFIYQMIWDIIKLDITNKKIEVIVNKLKVNNKKDYTLCMSKEWKLVSHKPWDIIPMTSWIIWKFTNQEEIKKYISNLPKK